MLTPGSLVVPLGEGRVCIGPQMWLVIKNQKTSGCRCLLVAVGPSVRGSSPEPHRASVLISDPSHQNHEK